MIREKNNQRFYLHEVVTEKRTATPFKTGTNQKTGTPSGVTIPSLISLLNKIKKIKENMSIDVDAYTEVANRKSIDLDSFSNDDKTIKELKLLEEHVDQLLDLIRKALEKLSKLYNE